MPVTIDQIEILKWVVGAVGFFIALLLTLIGWLLARAIRQLDTKLDLFTEGHAEHETRLVRVETHLGFGMPPAPNHRARHGTRDT